MRLLVNAPYGTQELIEIGEGGGYFDQSRVVWDERVDGDLPSITLGGMKRVGDSLEFDEDLMAATNAVIAAAEAEKNEKEMQIFLAGTRELRERILNRLSGICAAALRNEDSELADACLTARQSLLDITQAPSVLAAQTAAELKAALMAEYSVIVDAAPENLHNAFERVDE